MGDQWGLVHIASRYFQKMLDGTETHFMNMNINFEFKEHEYTNLLMCERILVTLSMNPAFMSHYKCVSNMPYTNTVSLQWLTFY